LQTSFIVCRLALVLPSKRGGRLYAHPIELLHLRKPGQLKWFEAERVGGDALGSQPWGREAQQRRQAARRERTVMGGLQGKRAGRAGVGRRAGIDWRGVKSH